MVVPERWCWTFESSILCRSPRSSWSHYHLWSGAISESDSDGGSDNNSNSNNNNYNDDDVVVVMMMVMVMVVVLFLQNTSQYIYITVV